MCIIGASLGVHSVDVRWMLGFKAYACLQGVNSATDTYVSRCFRYVYKFISKAYETKNEIDGFVVSNNSNLNSCLN